MLAVINAWVQSKEPGGPKCAEELLTKMEESYKGGDESIWQNVNRNLPTSGLDSGSSWLDGVNGILMQQEPNLPKQDYWNQRAIASLANTLITVVEPVPMPLLSSMLLLQL
jgi:hypothetical protein